MKTIHEFKLAGAGVWAGIAAALGWKGLLVLAWAALMALDYITGTMSALKSGHWSSSQAREGAWHKCGAMVVVTVAAAADGIMLVICGNIPVLNIRWPQVLLPMVLAWYILTELGSILENAVTMGANPPGWLAKALEISKNAVDSAAEKENS